MAQIGDKIGYSREHLSKSAKAKDETPGVYNALTAHFGPFGGTSQNVTNTTDKILGVIVELMEKQNKILDRQEKELVGKVMRIDANLNGVIGRTESLHYDLVSGRATVLRSLSRIEGRAEEELLQEADSIRRSLAVAKNERYKKAAGGKKGR